MIVYLVNESSTSWASILSGPLVSVIVAVAGISLQWIVAKKNNLTISAAEIIKMRQEWIEHLLQNISDYSALGYEIAAMWKSFTEKESKDFEEEKYKKNLYDKIFNLGVLKNKVIFRLSPDVENHKKLREHVVDVYNEMDNVRLSTFSYNYSVYDEIERNINNLNHFAEQFFNKEWRNIKQSGFNSI